MTLCTPYHLAPMLCHIGRVSGPQRTKNRGKMRYVGSVSPKFESSGTEFNYFLKLPEVRWTPEFFTRVLWVSTDEVKLFRRKNEKDFLVKKIKPV